MTLPRPPAPRLLSGIALVAFVVPAIGQVAPVSQSPAPEAEPVVRLNPFEVRSEKDYGYRAGAAISGTGTAGLIIDTPLNISVISQELISDQGANQLVEVLRAASSVAVHVKDESVILVRGYAGPKFVNGLPAGGGFSLYDIDRIEVVKGPNAVFAGSANAGGTVNMIAMKPSLDKAHGSVSLAFGDYDYNRFVFRTSGPIVPDRLGYMFVYGHTNEGSAIEHMFNRERFYSGGLTVRPLPNLTLTARYSTLDREAGRRPYLTVSHPLFQEMDKEAMDLFDSRGLPRPSAYPQLENGAVRDANGNPIATGRNAPEGVDGFIARTLGPNVPPFTTLVFEEFMGSPWANYNGPEGRDNYDNENLTLDLDYTFSPDLSFRTVYQAIEGTRMRREFNGFRPVAGQRFRSNSSDFAPAYDSYQVKTELFYKHDLGKAGRHDVLLGFQYGDRKQVTRPANGTTQINYNPRTDPTPRLLQLLQQRFGADYVEPSTTKVANPHGRSIYGVLQSSFADDRIRTLLGGRLAEGRPSKKRDFVPQYAVLGRVTSNLSVYGSVSETYQGQFILSADLEEIRRTQGDPTSPGYVPPTVVPQKAIDTNLLGEGYEFGMKLNLRDGELLGTFSYFQTSEQNRLEVDSVNQQLYQLPGGSVRVASGKTRARGVESEIIWTPNTQFQAILSTSYYFEAEEVTNPADAREIGSHLEAVPKYNVNLWGKYTLNRGALKGLYFGGGFNAMGEIGIHPSWTVPIRSDPSLVLNGLLGYRTAINNVPVDFRINANNLTDELYLNGTFQYGEPRTFRATVEIKW